MGSNAIACKRDFNSDIVFKQSVERELYNKAARNWGIFGNATIVAGPDVIRHIINARETIACVEGSTINIVDYDHRIQDQQIHALYNSKRRIPTWGSVDIVKNPSPGESIYIDKYTNPITKDVDFTLDYIEKVKSTIFIDADLMGSIKTAGSALQLTLLKQRNTFSINNKNNQMKAFIFTLSIRPVGLYDTMKWVLEKLIPITGSSCIMDVKFDTIIDDDARISFTDFKGLFNHRYNYKEIYDKSILHDVVMVCYNDGGGVMLTGIVIYS